MPRTTQRKSYKNGASNFQFKGESNNFKAGNPKISKVKMVVELLRLSPTEKAKYTPWPWPIPSLKYSVQIPRQGSRSTFLESDRDTNSETYDSISVQERGSKQEQKTIESDMDSDLDGNVPLRLKSIRRQESKKARRDGKANGTVYKTMDLKNQSSSTRHAPTQKGRIKSEDEYGMSDMSVESSPEPILPSSSPVPLRRHSALKRKLPRSSESDQEEEEDESRFSEPSELDLSILTTHREFCEKCLQKPSIILQQNLEAKRKRKGGKNRERKRRAKTNEDGSTEDEFSEEELLDVLGGWATCRKCVVASHFGCLGESQKKAVLDKLRAEDTNKRLKTEAQVDNEKNENGHHGGNKRKTLEIDETVTFMCRRCNEVKKCMICWRENISEDEVSNEVRNVKDNRREGEISITEQAGLTMSPLSRTLVSDTSNQTPNFQNCQADDVNADSKSSNPLESSSTSEFKFESTNSQSDDSNEEEKEASSLLFRCLRCKQAAHYEHLRPPKNLGENFTLLEKVHDYQSTTEDGKAWHCHECRDWPWGVDMIIAWRPLANSSVSLPPISANATYPLPSLWKLPAPREYLIKFTFRSFRHVTWVPHNWLQSLAPTKLKRFLEKGPILNLITDESLAASDGLDNFTIEGVLGMEDNDDETVDVKPEEDAEMSLPILWSTVDRVLDVKLLRLSLEQVKGKGKVFQPTKAQNQPPRVLFETSVISENQDFPTSRGTLTPFEVTQKELNLKDGIPPPENSLVEIEEWERMTGRKLRDSDADEVAGLVAWCYIKWEDLQYDQACWDTPPPTNTPLYSAFKAALTKFLKARHIRIPILTSAQIKRQDEKGVKGFVPPQQQPDCIVGGSLMSFQLEGFQWLLYKFFKRESCILADDMGLGKTVQIASMLGYLGSKEHQIYPCLVVVPNSTITNWVREFEKWSPHLRVVPYYGEAAARKVIHQYELFHKGMQGKAEGLKAHIVLTTYDMITSSEFRVFSLMPRWEVLCVDEGQRLKSDSSKIFNNLKTLNSVHRILLTGTPLNNNIRELFNLLNFLDPLEFSDLDTIEEEYEDLTEVKVQKLHQMIKPYILRRIKADVLNLPPKVEIIVPITLTPLQKQVYKSIIEKNVEVIQEILKVRQKKMKVKKPVMLVGNDFNEQA
ncbi:uncharacterized protein L203_105849 [Cryptococcus depauperatus CBS 7841]|uniref:Uncharacterized protein n=1 Tax=Cryptococcus depauperatus CBS 7841 TaxID=1295531 RepID=A0A1E3IA79_9TREE|nr:hypothetical protein L203_05004 [Cryptococcus depauperatus CBS 7841]